MDGWLHSWFQDHAGPIWVALTGVFTVGALTPILQIVQIMSGTAAIVTAGYAIRYYRAKHRELNKGD